MKRTLPNDNFTVAEAQQALAATVLIELELGMTFVDVAENTRDRKHALQSIKNAITALRTADKFLSEIEPGTNVDGIKQRRGELAERLRAITGVEDSGGSP